MSRIGQKPIPVPEGVNVILDDHQVVVKSSQAELSQPIPRGIKVTLKDKQIIVTQTAATRQAKALFGLTRSLIANMVAGITRGFSKTLELQGTGYRVNPKDKGIELSLGFSHPIVYQAPQGVSLEIKEQKFITVKGFDKQLVGQVAANIRAFRPPDAYKGKGIRYQDEVVRLKPGKAAKAGESES